MWNLLHILAAAAVLGTAEATEPPEGFGDALDFAARDATVLVFVYTDCPVANTMAPALTELHEAYAEREVAFYRVYADRTVSTADADEHGEAYDLAFPAILDVDYDLVRFTGATITPEVVVYDRAGERRYRGRINDKYKSLGVYRQEPTTHDLRDALEAVLAGEAVPNPETTAIGCFLPQPEIDVDETTETES